MLLQSFGAIAMGSTTYEWIYDHDFSSRAEDSQSCPYKIPTWGFSSRKLPIITDADTRFVSGDVRPIHQEMAFAAGDKNIWIVSSGDLAGQFYECGLLNEIVVRIASVTIFGQDFVELYYQVPAR